MGKRLIQQRRGRGSIFKSPRFRYLGESKHIIANEETKGTIKDIVKCASHSAPLAKVEYENGKENLMIVPEGVKVNQELKIGNKAEPKLGNTLALANIPEGTNIFNIELKPGDGGKLVRTSGTSAKILAKTKDQVIVILPSKKQKTINANCRATIGVVAGSGRTEKPLMKAGNQFHKRKAKRQLYPITSGAKMSAYAHPLGNKRSSRKSKNKPVSKNAPPGRKAGMVGARRTGRKKK